mgnify:CR=1 FL=1
MEADPLNLFAMTPQERRLLVLRVTAIALDRTRPAAVAIAAMRVIMQTEWLNLAAATVDKFNGAAEAGELVKALRHLAERCT